MHPKFVNVCEKGGIGWLAGFDEWLCRCGLAFNGPPGEDVYTDRHGQTHRDLITLHGRIANQPAHYVEARVGLDPPFEMSIIGAVEEAGLFHPHLRLTTTLTTVPGSNRLVLHDVVENRGAQPAEMMLLYHCNLGPPFLEAGSRRRGADPRGVADQRPGRRGDRHAGRLRRPTAGFAEQVYCFDLLADACGPNAGDALQSRGRPGRGAAFFASGSAVFHGLAQHHGPGRRLRHRAGAGDEFSQLQDRSSVSRAGCRSWLPAANGKRPGASKCTTRRPAWPACWAKSPACSRTPGHRAQNAAGTVLGAGTGLVGKASGLPVESSRARGASKGLGPLLAPRGANTRKSECSD